MKKIQFEVEDTEGNGLMTRTQVNLGTNNRAHGRRRGFSPEADARHSGYLCIQESAIFFTFPPSFLSLIPPFFLFFGRRGD